MRSIQIQNNTSSKLSKKYLNKLKSLALKIIKTQTSPNSLKPFNNIQISITFITNKNIKKLNLQYRKINSPTDVIAFRIDTGTTNNITLGDIYISIERALKQISPNETIELELARLLIHGVLHVLGYDHSYKMTRQEKHYLSFLKTYN
jgi:probable rRNA maturation factor